MTQIMLQTPTNASMAMFTQFAMIAAMFAILYFFMIRPQKKKEKEIQLMRSKLEVGDEIVTIGGIIGRVVNIKDETIVIETGSDRSKIRITRWAVQQNNSANRLCRRIKRDPFEYPVTGIKEGLG